MVNYFVGDSFTTKSKDPNTPLEQVPPKAPPRRIPASPYLPLYRYCIEILICPKYDAASHTPPTFFQHTTTKRHQTRLHRVRWI